MRSRISSPGAGVCADTAAPASCDPSTPEPWLSLKAASKYACFDERTLRRRAQAGLLQHGKLGRNLRFKPSDIDAMLWNGAAQTEVAGGAA